MEPANATEEATTSSAELAAEQRRKRFRYGSAAIRTDDRLRERGLKESRLMACLTNSSVWWRHPVCRIGVTWIILFEDFYIYGEDPVNDSHVGVNYIGMGNCLGLFTFWSAPSVGEAILKVVLVAIALAGAVLIGRQFILRKILRERFKISAFSGGEGCLLVVGVTFLGTSFVASYIYNLIATDVLDGNSFEAFLVIGAETKQYRHVGKFFQVLSSCIDFLTIVMITDAVLQDRLHHQFWASGVKRWYNHALGGYARIIACWSLLLGGTCSAAVLIFRTGSGDEDIRWTDTNVGGTSELERSFLAACIVFTDLLTVIQDWDFPMFRDSLDVEVPVMIAGTNMTQLRLGCVTSCIRRCPRLPERVLALLPSSGAFTMHITGKWLTYGPLLGVMGVDFMCARAQMLYEPVNYGHYVDPANDRIWVIVDQPYLNLAYVRGVVVNASMIRWEARRNVTTGAPLDASASTDIQLNSRFADGPGMRYLALMLCLGSLAFFFCLIWMADWQRINAVDRIEAECAHRQDQTCDGCAPDAAVVGREVVGSPVAGERRSADATPASAVLSLPPVAFFPDQPQLDALGLPTACDSQRYPTKLSL